MRCFVAIELPEPVRRRLGRLVQAFQPARAKWCTVAQFHVTLKFLGEVDDPRVAGVCQTVTTASAAVSPFELRFTHCGAFPSPERPRVVFCGLHDAVAGCERWLAAADPALEQHGFPREQRVFTPHVTLGRIRSPHDAAGVRAALTERRDALERAVPREALRVECITLFESRTGPGGSEYVAFQRAPLCG